ncbi:MAG: hypothetical protein JXR10_05200 [Cyclobacteriaceae bacterium]
MRKAIILSFLSVFLLVTKSEAQHFSYVNNVGVQHPWDLPHSVYNQIDYHYYGYDLVHVGNFWRNGFNLFDVTLRRGNVFVQLEIGRRGRILSRQVTRSFPFQGHACGSHCGFHSSFYTQSIASCNAPYYNYFRQPRRPQSVVYVNRAYGNGNKHYGNHGHGQKGKGKSRSYESQRRNNQSNARTESRTQVDRNDSRSNTRVANTTQPVYRSRSRVN